MDPLIHHNGSVVDGRSLGIAPTSGGLLYGWGVFTTIRVYNGKPFAFAYHWERLTKHAEKLRIHIPLDAAQAEAAIESLIRANARTQGRVRITAFKSESGSWRIGRDLEDELLIFTAPEPKKPDGDLAITISPYRVLSTALLAGVKQTSMLEHLFALDEARSRGFGEAVMLNERGEIVGATAANIFWVEGDEVFTPSLSTGCIAGITRRIVHDLAIDWKLHVVEGSFPVTRLLSAREVFLTSTLREISIVRNFDAKEYQPRQARIAKLLSRQFQSLTRGDTINPTKGVKR